MAQAREISVMEPSVLAIATLYAFKNTLETEHGHLFTPEEIKLIHHLLNAVIVSEPSQYKWVCEKIMEKLPSSTQRFFLNKMFTPEYAQHAFAKKYMIKLKIEHAIQHGHVQQLVFLSYELDQQGFNSAKMHNIPTFDLCPKKIAELKLKAVQTACDGKFENFQSQDNNAHTCINENYHLISHDFLCENIKSILRTCGYDTEKKTLFIVDGLSKYLPSAVNSKLLKDISNLSIVSNEVLISYRVAYEINPLETCLQYLNQQYYCFALPPEDIAKTTIQSGLVPIKKIFYNELLKWMSIQMKTHDENHAAGFEHFYLLEKNSSDRMPNIEELPLITNDLAVVNILQPTRNCIVM